MVFEDWIRMGGKQDKGQVSDTRCEEFDRERKKEIETECVCVYVSVVAKKKDSVTVAA